MAASVLLSALDTDQAKTVGVGVIIALIVIGLVVNLIISKIIWRAVTIVFVVVLAVAVYSERSNIQSSARHCDANFFGYHLTPSNPTLKKHCQQVANR